jgi:hypothetical protein
MDFPRYRLRFFASGVICALETRGADEARVHTWARSVKCPQFPSASHHHQRDREGNNVPSRLVSGVMGYVL